VKRSMRLRKLFLANFEIRRRERARTITTSNVGAGWGGGLDHPVRFFQEFLERIDGESLADSTTKSVGYFVPRMFSHNLALA